MEATRRLFSKLLSRVNHAHSKPAAARSIPCPPAVKMLVAPYGCNAWGMTWYSLFFFAAPHPSPSCPSPSPSPFPSKILGSFAHLLDPVVRPANPTALGNAVQFAPQQQQYHQQHQMRPPQQQVSEFAVHAPVGGTWGSDYGNGRCSGIEFRSRKFSECSSPFVFPWNAF